ncbi:hypothetical protein ABIE56_000260 [Luteibacter sp. 621]|uniref:hypothetical protein n=1 Tax=Luteibacter sp. 621 TaxID=3373916 RepID=UPI003D1BA135
MSNDSDAHKGAALPGGELHAGTTPRDVVAAISAYTNDKVPFLVVILRSGDPWLVPDTAAGRESLGNAGIDIIPLRSARQGALSRPWSADISHWAQMAVALRDADAIGWLLVVMKTGTVCVMLDNPARRLELLALGVPMVTASASREGITRVLLPNG